MKTTKLLILTIVISLNTAFAQENTDSPHLTNDKAPELATFDINNLSYSFEQTLPDLSNAFLDSSPADRADDISVGNLAVNGNSRASIMQLSREIAEGKHGNYDGMLISHQGKLVFESYYRKGRINLPHFQASVTKAYISLAIGRAIQLGYLTMNDLNKPIIHILESLDLENLADGAENITLHHLMSMRSGIRVSADTLESIVANGSNTTQGFLQHSAAISSETQTFKYQGIDPRITWQILDSVVPGSAEDFIKNEILAKIGIAVYGWKNDVEGSSITSRGMLKLGALVMNKGMWNNEQLISAEYLANATSSITKATEDWQPDNFFYGYFWYQTEIRANDKSYVAKLAWGGGGQYIITVEELDLIVVITGHDSEDKIMTQVSKTILPAFVKDKFPVLEGPSLGQKPPGLIPELFAPGIVSTEEYLESALSFLPDMKELSFTRSGGKYKKPTLFVMQYKNHRWSRKSVLSTDIQKYKERFTPSLSEMKSLEPFKDIPITGFSVSAKGTYYFYFLERGDGSGHMSYSRLINGKYEKPQKMSKEINTGKYIAHPFIAPDESYLMWDAEKEGEDTPDIYISFRQKDGSWGAAINMGAQINTAGYEQRPKVTPDGKYLTFWKGDVKHREDGSRYVVGSPYWVDAQVIENLRPKQ